MQVKISITFHRAEINLFQDKQIIFLHQADYMQRNSVLIKVKYEIDYLPKIA